MAADSLSQHMIEEKFGEIEGEKLYVENSKNHRKTSKRCKEFWIKNGYSEEEAKEKVSERQRTFALDICIEKYGEVDGLQRWLDRQEKWQNTLNSKSEEELLIIKKKKNTFSKESYLLRGLSEEDSNLLLKNRFNNFRRTYSKESITFIQKNLITEDCFFGENEWYIYDKENHRHCFYDFTNVNKKIILEYHGEAFHPNINRCWDSYKYGWSWSRA